MNFDQRFMAMEEQLNGIPTSNYVAAIGRVFGRGCIAKQVVEGGQGLAVEQGPVSTRVYPISLCNGSQSQVRKGRNFSQDEECQLCRSFLSICQDPIVGNGQKSPAFWTQICEDYNIKRPKGRGKELS